jgi:hypothetical protein
MSLTLLPLYASDFPGKDKKNYYGLLIKWARRNQLVIDHYIQAFTGSVNITGRISVRQFIETAKKLDIYNVLEIRQVANTQVVL